MKDCLPNCALDTCPQETEDSRPADGEHCAPRSRKWVHVQGGIAVDGLVTEEAIYRALAAELGVRFLASVDPDLLVIQPQDGVAELVRNDLRCLARLSGVAGAASLVLARSTSWSAI
jgi:hypothetical protein